MFNSRSLKKAMTLSELLMAIGVLGVIAALVLPILFKTIPNKEEAKHKKVNSIIELVISQLYDDEIMYPKRSDFGKQGFQNLDKATINGVEYEGNTKFCLLFASRFKISEDSGPIICENEINESDNAIARGKKSFTSKDGVDWYLPVTTFKKGVAEVVADINGSSEGQNCIKGDEGCTEPDKFIYYVKSNGTITNTKPTNVIQDKFDIIVKVQTEGCNTSTCQNSGGTYKIATLTQKADGSYQQGNFSNDASKYKNLASNTRYIIEATPKADYYTNWSQDKKRVSVYNSDVYIDLIFRKRKTYCVILDIMNCTEEHMTDCATYKLQKKCGYVIDTEGQGEYKLNSDGAFEYVGLYNGGNYVYKCTGDSINLEQQGHPIVGTDGTITNDPDHNAVYLCGLTPGDYQLTVTPTTSNEYYIFPKNTYLQNIPLGSNNLTFTVTLTKNNPEP